MLRAIAFFDLATSAFASATLDVLVNAAASFSATIQQQLKMLQSKPSPGKACRKDDRFVEPTGELRLESIKSPRLPLIL